MVQKLLEDRFQLTFHREKKELPVYAITVAKSGVKLSKSDANAGSLPGFGGRGPGSIGVRNSNIADFAGFLQSRVVDRPVVDQTSPPDRYDFTLRPPIPPRWQPWDRMPQPHLPQAPTRLPTFLPPFSSSSD